MIQKILLKTGIFISLLVFIQYLYFTQVSKWYPSIKPPSRMQYLVNRDINSTAFDYVYIGSSINFTKSRLDKDKRDIVQMVSDTLGCGMLDISRGGNNVELYDDILKYVEKRLDEKKQYIFEISIRTFSPVYDEPANASSLKQDEILFREDLLSAFYNPLKVFKYDFNIMSTKEFNDSPIYDGDTYLGNLTDIIKTEEAHVNTKEIAVKKFLVNYMGHIKEDHPKVLALKQLTKYIKENKIKALFYITPENFTKGVEYYPKTFLAKFSRNTNYIKQVIEHEGFDVLDLSQRLDASYFTHSPIYPNGHLDERGRKIVSKELSNLLTCN